jgi:hypothetical protein
MKFYKLASVTFGALLCFAIVAANALAAVSLPDISVTLTGGKYPVHSVGSLPNAATSLGSSSGIALEGKGVTLLLLTTELSALGTFTSDFTEVVEPLQNKCHTSGDAEGVVLVGGEFHLVPTNLSPLNLGTLFLVTEFVIICPIAGNITVHGNVLGSLNGIGSEGTELTGFSGTLKGENGKQQLSEYYNDGGTKVKTKLISESSLTGVTEADENVEGELGLSVLGSQMVVITGR